MIIYFSMVGYVIACIEVLAQCTVVPDVHLAKLVFIGAVELIFEVVGIVKVYRTKGK